MTTAIVVRPVTADEYDAYGAVLALGFGGDYDAEEQARERELIPLEDTLAAFEGDQLVGTEGVYRMALNLPGGETVSMAGVTSIAVLPTHRRRGVLTALMRRRLEGMHEAGQWLAGLWASENVIYGRYGYGVATERVGLEVNKRRAAFGRPLTGAGRVRLVDREEAMAVIPMLFEQAIAGWPGTMPRGEAWWRYLWHDPKDDREGRSALLFAIHATAGRDDAYAVYRTKFDWAADAPTEVYVADLGSTSNAGYAGTWRYLLDIDLMDIVVAARRPVDEPLTWMLADRAAIRGQVREGLWLRPVDVATALAARRYAQEGCLVLEVKDAFCPWNGGRYLLTGGPDGATCEPTSKAADIVLDAAVLGATYLGGVRLSTLARAGRVQEESPGAVARADALLRGNRAPWCDRVF